MNGFAIFAEMSDLAALFTAVQSNQFQDLPKLVIADFLDENKEPDLATYIRAVVGGASGKDVQNLKDKITNDLENQGVSLVVDSVFEKNPDHDELDTWWNVGPHGVVKRQRELHNYQRKDVKVPISQVPEKVIKGLILLMLGQIKNPNIRISVLISRLTSVLLETIREYERLRHQNIQFTSLVPKDMEIKLEEVEKYIDHIKNQDIDVPEHILRNFQYALQEWANRMEDSGMQHRKAYTIAERILKKI